jgi:hypothetical protein
MYKYLQCIQEVILLSTKIITMRKITLFILTTFVLFGCKQERFVYKNPHFVEAEQVAARIVTDSCSCLTTSQVAPCNNGSTAAKIISQFLGGQTSITKTVKWSHCTAPLINDPNCNAPYNNVTSQLKLCWHDCNTITAQLN